MTDSKSETNPNPNEPIKSLLADPNATPVVTEFVPDPAKSAEENATAKTAFETAAAKVVADKKLADDAAAKKLEDDKKTEAEKAAAAKANDTKANPFKFEEIKLPDGFTIDEPIAKGFVEVVNKFGLGRDAVGELVKLQADAMKGVSEAGNKLYSDMRDGWKKEITADAEFGGEKLAANLGSISKLVDEFGGPELRSQMDLTGAGDNPHMIRFLTKVAKAVQERPFVPPGGQADIPKDVAALLFPTHNKP